MPVQIRENAIAACKQREKKPKKEKEKEKEIDVQSSNCTSRAMSWGKTMNCIG